MKTYCSHRQVTCPAYPFWLVILLQKITSTYFTCTCICICIYTYSSILYIYVCIQRSTTTKSQKFIIVEIKTAHYMTYKQHLRTMITHDEFFLQSYKMRNLILFYPEKILRFW